MKKQSELFQIAIYVVALFFVVFGCNEDPPPEFTHVINQAVFGSGVFDEWDDYSVAYPAIIRDGDTLRMWYYGLDQRLSYSGKSQIGYAWSLGGVAWNRYAANPVFSDSLAWEDSLIGTCRVIKDGETFKMWYGAGAVPATKIGYATSRDGIKWSRHPQPVLELGPAGDWDDSYIFPGTIIKEDGVYKMWYSGSTGSFGSNDHVARVGFATSSDGITWVKFDNSATTDAPFSSSDAKIGVGKSGSWDAQRAWGPCVLPKDSGYEMWYSGAILAITEQWIGYALSTNGTSWKKWTGNPMLDTPPDWGQNYFTDTMLKFDGKYHLWHTTWDISGRRSSIGYLSAVAD